MELMHAWRNRIIRIGDRAQRKAMDVSRLLNWHAGGGKRHFESCADKLLSGHKWCFIVGCNNSGTSLLQRFLELVDGVSTFPHEGQRYTLALKRAEKRGHERVWSEYVDELRMTEHCDRSVVPRLLHDWMSALDTPVGDTVVEKTTANAVRMRWLQSVFDRSYFIGLVRNGYAVAEGIKRKGGKDVVRGARHWASVNKSMLEDAAQIKNFLLVRYEDLVLNPVGVAEAITDFVDMDPIDVRFVDNEIGKIRDFNAESIQQLSDREIRLIYAEAGEMLDYFGYKAHLSEGIH